MLEQFRSRQFVAFLITGGFAAAVNFCSRIAYSHWVDFSTAIVLAYITGMVTAFVLAKLFVFKESQRALHHSAFYFALVNLIAVAQTWLISMGLYFYAFPFLGVTHYSEDIAHGLGVLVPVFTSYIGHKHLSFK